jgi:hypothetical protein
MKISEIPQDDDPAFEGGKKLCYAVNESGKFVAAQSSGWNVEATVKEVAWNVIHQNLAATRARVLIGEASWLEYHMKARQMNPRLLAQNMGMSVWRVRRHLRPRIFSKLNDKWLSRYARCLEVSMQNLRGEA